MRLTHVHLPPPFAGAGPSDVGARLAPFAGHLTQPHPSLSLHAKSGAFGFISPSRLRSRLSQTGPSHFGQFIRPPGPGPPPASGCPTARLPLRRSPRRGRTRSESTAARARGRPHRPAPVD